VKLLIRLETVIYTKAENNAGSRNDKNSEDWSLFKFLLLDESGKIIAAARWRWIRLNFSNMNFKTGSCFLYKKFVSWKRSLEFYKCTD
jgi:hypothetical protein